MIFSFSVESPPQGKATYICHKLFGMQFLYPSFLWALLLLLIPVLVHLFQLRRFKRTPFTNVALLQKLNTESNKSKTIKRWLLLLSRLLALTALVLAFARPVYIRSEKPTNNSKPYFIYLDNSLSMQAQRQGISLLENAIQLLVKELPDDQYVELHTNDRTFGPDRWESLRNKIVGLQTTSKQRSLGELVLRLGQKSAAESEYSRALLLSDFQQSKTDQILRGRDSVNAILFPLRPEIRRNVWIDSLAILSETNNSMTLKLWIQGGQADENIGISVYERERLLAKTTANAPGAERRQLAELSLAFSPELNGVVEIQDNSLTFDNRFYFSINQTEQIRVMAIGKARGTHLERIFQNEDFSFLRQELKRLDFGLIPRQNLILLDQLERIPASLQEALVKFHEEGGSLCIIPASSASGSDYTQLMSTLGNFAFSEKASDTLRIDRIRAKHPLYQGVFRQEVEEFDAPEIRSFYRIGPSSQAALVLENERPFLISYNRISLFAAPLDLANGSFSLSPLVVPTFYNMGKQSIRLQDVYVRMGTAQRVDVPFSTPSDQVLRLRSMDFEYIPSRGHFLTEPNCI